MYTSLPLTRIWHKADQEKELWAHISSMMMHYLLLSSRGWSISKERGACIQKARIRTKLDRGHDASLTVWMEGRGCTV